MPDIERTSLDIDTFIAPIREEFLKFTGFTEVQEQAIAALMRGAWALGIYQALEEPVKFREWLSANGYKVPAVKSNG